MKILWFNLKYKSNNIIVFILLNTSIYKLYINKMFTFIIFVYNLSKIIIIISSLSSSFKTLFKFSNVINILIYHNYI